jgi:ribosomal protein L24E
MTTTINMDNREDFKSKKTTGKQINELNLKFYKLLDESNYCDRSFYEIGVNEKDIIFKVKGVLKNSKNDFCGRFISMDKYSLSDTCDDSDRSVIIKSISIEQSIIFGTIDEIFNHFTERYNICEIEIPDDAECYVQPNKFYDLHKFHSNKIIVKNIKKLKDLDKWNDDFFCLKAVKQNGMILRFVKTKTKEICLEAIRQNPTSLKFVEEYRQTQEICLEAITKNGLVLRFIKEQNKLYCLEAVKQDWNSLRYVKNQTNDLCMVAAKQDILSLNLIRDKKQKQEITDICSLEFLKEQIKNGVTFDFFSDY